MRLRKGPKSGILNLANAHSNHGFSGGAGLAHARAQAGKELAVATCGHYLATWKYSKPKVPNWAVAETPEPRALMPTVFSIEAG